MISAYDRTLINQSLERIDLADLYEQNDLDAFKQYTSKHRLNVISAKIACTYYLLHGHKDIVKYLYEEFDVHHERNWTLAAIGGDIDFLKWQSKKENFSENIYEQIFCHAAKYDHINILEWVLEKFPNISHVGPAFRVASHETLTWLYFKNIHVGKMISDFAKYGDIPIIKQLIRAHNISPYDFIWAGINAVKNDQLIALKMVARFIPRSQYYTIFEAAVINSLGSAKWILSMIHVDIYTSCYKNVARNNKFENLKWLLSIKDIDTQVIIIDACTSGNIEMIEFLYYDEIPDITMIGALHRSFHYDHVHLVDWILAKRPHLKIKEVDTLLFDCNNMLSNKSIQKLKDLNYDVCTDRAIRYAYKYNNLEGLKILYKDQNLIPDMYYSLEHDNVVLIDWVNQQQPINLTDTLKFAIIADANKVILWLIQYTNVTELQLNPPILEHCVLAHKEHYLTYFLEISECNLTKDYESALSLAIEKDYLEAVQTICKMRPVTIEKESVKERVKNWLDNLS